MVVCNEYCNTKQVLGTNVEHKAAQSGTKRIRGTHVRTSVGINVGADVSCTTSRSLCRRTVALSDRRIAGSLTNRWRTFDGLLSSRSFVWVNVGLGQRVLCDWVIVDSVGQSLGTSTWMLVVSHCLLLCRVRTREFVPSRIRTSHFHPRYRFPEPTHFRRNDKPQGVCNRFDSARYCHSHMRSPSGCR